MSKRLWNAFYRMLPVSLLETAQPCIENASMDIVIEERMRDGSAETYAECVMSRSVTLRTNAVIMMYPSIRLPVLEKSRFPISRQYSMSSYRRMKAGSR